MEPTEPANGRRTGGQYRRLGSLLVAVIVVGSIIAGATSVAVASERTSVESQNGTAAQSVQFNGTSQSLAESDGTANSQHTTVTGTVEYQARNGTMVSAKQVQVDIRKNGLTNPVIASTTTDDNGQYSVQLDVAAHENGPGNQLNVKVQAEAANPAVEVVGFASTRYEVETTGQIPVGANSATFDLQATSADRRHAFQAADWALEARRFHQNATGFAPKQVRIDLNASISDDRYQSPLDKITLSSDWGGNKNFTVYHEYGHATLDGLYDHTGWKIPKFNTWGINTDEGWIPCHVSYSETSVTYAWYEGFAFLTEAAVNESEATDGLNLEGSHYFNQSQTHPECHDGDGSPHPDYDGAKVEGAVASILWDLHDGKNEAHDDINTSLREIYATVSKTEVKSSIAKRNTKQVENITTFWNQYVNESNHAELGRIYFEYGIQKPDRFEGNDSPSAAAKLGHGVTNLSKLSGGYPLDGYNVSGGAQLNYGDSADHYEFPAQKNEWVTIDVNSTQGNAGIDLRVYGPSGNKIASSTQRGSNESISFRAPKDGTFAQDPNQYRIKVDKGARGRVAGTYTFDIQVSPADKFDDKYEENDGFPTAPLLSPGWYYPKLVDVDTSDIYAVRLRSNESLDVQAEFYHSKTDIDLRLYGPSARSASNPTPLARSTSNTDDERITYNAQKFGSHYLKVSDSGLSRLQVFYDLEIKTLQQPSKTYEDDDKPQKWKATDLKQVMKNTGPPGPQAGTLKAGYTPGDPDYYKLTLNKNQDVTVNMTNVSQATSVRVVTPNGKKYQVAGTEGFTELLRTTSSGTYYFNVSAGTDFDPRYEIHVSYGRAITSDHLEPNNGYKSATDATPGITANSNRATKSWSGGQYDRALQVDGTSADEDYFEVSLSSGDTVTATVNYDAYKGNITLEIVGNGRTKQVSGPTGLHTASLTASSSGDYYVIVKDSSQTPSKVPYDLTIEKQQGVATGRQLEVGTSVNPDVDFGKTWFLGDGFDTGFNWSSIGEDVQTQPPCTLAETKRFTRTVDSSAGTSVKVGKTRSVPVDRPAPCKVVVLVSGPSKADVNVYLTLDGSTPTTSNYQIAGTQSGSSEKLVIEPSDGLTGGTVIQALARGYPIAGDYEVIVQIYRR